MTSTHAIERLVAAIKPMLAGHPPERQGAVLADLVATFLAGHAPPLREELLTLHIELVRSLIPANEYELFGAAGFPRQRQ